ncbi:MAG TPA: PilT/PilU family type 4a pilus ATPase [Gemmatimonadales bacterium]|nr:PilT/PilU family type 4a pilus ATPase [Gemmatimonadales bacterium]
MEKIIKAAVERGASDLHIKAGDVFRARINGKLVPLTKQRLTPEQTRAIALQLMSSDVDRARIEQLRDFDCSWGMPGVGRFRVNVLRQRSSFMVVMRVIPFTVPTLDELALPAALAQVAESDRGLVLVAGVSGSGKSSTVAAMIHHVNRTQHRHVVTIENPIEFLHRDINCSITQREVGVDTESLAIGLRAALRQDPDVVVIGDMADAETLDVSLKAAETGRLVIATVPAPNVAGAVERVLATLEPGEREIGRVRFGEAVRAIVAQQLLPTRNGAGRVAVAELMVATPAVRDCVKAPARLDELAALMAAARDDGMQTFEQHLLELVEAGRITREAAAAATAAMPSPAPAARPGAAQSGGRAATPNSPSGGAPQAPSGRRGKQAAGA